MAESEPDDETEDFEEKLRNLSDEDLLSYLKAFESKMGTHARAARRRRREQLISRGKSLKERRQALFQELQENISESDRVDLLLEELDRPFQEELDELGNDESEDEGGD